jgi:hypothetical protein
LQERHVAGTRDDLELAVEGQERALRLTCIEPFPRQSCSILARLTGGVVAEVQSRPARELVPERC